MSYVCDFCEGQFSRDTMNSIGAKKPDTRNNHQHVGHLCKSCTEGLFHE